MFHVIPDAYCILRTRKGVYRQEKVYGRSGNLYARWGGGWVMLKKSGSLLGTSNPDVSWEEIDVPFEWMADKLGRLTAEAIQPRLTNGTDNKQLEGPK